MVGDKEADVECGRRAGVAASILVRTGKGQALEGELRSRTPDLVVLDDVAAAAHWILGGRS